MVNAIPKGFHSVTPFFMSNDADSLLKFMQEGLGAKVVSILRQENGMLWHAQIKIGDSMLMLGDNMGMGASMPMSMYLYSDDADEAYKRALKAGATPISEPSDQFYGDRNAGVQDKFGNSWWFATHIEEVSEEELKKRARAFEKKAEKETPRKKAS